MTWPQYLRCCCIADGREVKLEPLEAELLVVLMMRAPHPVGVWELVECIYPDPDTQVISASNLVRVKVCDLRRKLGPEAIRTELGRGYLFAPPELAASLQIEAVYPLPGWRSRQRHIPITYELAKRSKSQKRSDRLGLLERRYARARAKVREMLADLRRMRAEIAATTVSTMKG